MTQDQTPHHQTEDELSRLVNLFEEAIAQKDFERAVELFHTHSPELWFGIPTRRFYELMTQIVTNYSEPDIKLHAWHRAISLTFEGNVNDRELLDVLETLDIDDLRFISFVRIFMYRLIGRPREALEQATELMSTDHKIPTVFDLTTGWELQSLVHVGVTAIQAGDFRLALSLFTQAQMHVKVPTMKYLTRDSLVKAGLIHGMYGDTGVARALIERSERVTRSSSWVERGLDAHRDLTLAIIEDDANLAMNKLNQVNLHDVGEMWPFYITAMYRILEATGYRDEVEARMEMFDQMPFPRVVGQGYTGSVIPLIRAMIAMDSGRLADAQAYIDESDPDLTYTKLVTAALHLYSGRLKQALQFATSLAPEVKGMRQMEIRRLSIIASAQFASEDFKGCLQTLEQAVGTRGLNNTETQYFSPEVRTFAEANIEEWNSKATGTSIFLTNLPDKRAALTDRELEIVKTLEQGYSRAEMAEKLFVSVNTLKTQLRSIYRKLGVSSGGDAILEAQRRGLV